MLNLEKFLIDLYCFVLVVVVLIDVVIGLLFIIFMCLERRLKNNKNKNWSKV